VAAVALVLAADFLLLSSCRSANTPAQPVGRNALWLGTGFTFEPVSPTIESPAMGHFQSPVLVPCPLSARFALVSEVAQSPSAVQSCPATAAMSAK
jgi:hypothetical protein